MPLSPHKAGAADWPPGPNPPAPRGAPDTSDAFAGLLNIQQARTAIAEGQSRSPERSDSPRDRDRDRDAGPVANDRAEARSNAAWAADRREADGTTRDRPAKASEQTADRGPQTATGDAAGVKDKTGKPVAGDPAAPADAPAAAAALAVLASATPGAQQVPNTNTNTSPNTPTPQHPNTPTSTTTTAQQLPVDPTAALAQGSASSAATVPAAGVSGSLDSTAAAAHGGVAAAAVSAVDQNAAQPASGQVPVAERSLPATPQPAAPVSAPADAKAGTPGGGQQNAGSAGQDVPEQSGTQAPVTSDTARVTQPQSQAQPEQAAPAVQPSGGQASPTLGGTPATQVPAARGGFAPPTPVPLARAAEAVEHVLQLASQRGVTHARIALHPEELGSIDVHLRSTSEGIVARLVAHAPEAAQQLQQAAADLRKSLEQQGLNLLNLDIGHQGDGRSAGRAGAGADGSGQNGSGSAGNSGEGDGAGDETSTDTSLQLPNGVLVDVLA